MTNEDQAKIDKLIRWCRLKGMHLAAKPGITEWECGEMETYGRVARMLRRVFPNLRRFDVSEYMPELGQACFGAPWSAYAIPEFAESLFETILERLRYIVQNRDQVAWDRAFDPKVPGVIFRSYCWNECRCPEGQHDPNCEACKPNFVFEEVEIRWYKYPGRGMSCNRELTQGEWIAWFDRCMAALRKYEAQVLDEPGMESAK